MDGRKVEQQEKKTLKLSSFSSFIKKDSLVSIFIAISIHADLKRWYGQVSEKRKEIKLNFTQWICGLVYIWIEDVGTRYNNNNTRWNWWTRWWEGDKKGTTEKINFFHLFFFGFSLKYGKNFGKYDEGKKFWLKKI